MSRKPRIMRLNGKKLKRLREEASLSQSELGKVSGVSLRQITRYEANDAEPTAHVLAAMSKALHCSADYLLDLTDKPTANSTGFTSDDREFLLRFYKLPQDIRDLIMGLVFRK